MNYLLFNKMQSIANRVSLSLVFLVFASTMAYSQNINIPNKTGPMGLEVNSYSGNLFFARTDFLIPGTELNMEISFAYNSYNFDINRGFGNGWSFKYDAWYYIDSLNNVIIIWGDGREDEYKPLGNGNFQAPVGFFSVLKEYESGKFSLTEKDGLKYLFDDPSGKRLTKIQTVNGRFIAVNYTNALITSITNHLGQAINFSYNTKGWLTGITDAITAPSRSWSYTYDDNGNLKEVTDPLGAKDQYTYLINGPIQTVTDKNLNVVDLVYFNDFSVREMVGCNKHISFSYDTTQKLTVVTDHMENGDNQVNKYYYTQIGKNSWLSAISGNCCGFDAKMEYDQNGNKIKQTDANGNVWQYTYDIRGNVLTVTDPLSQTTTYTYTQDYNRISSVTDPKGNTSHLEYDSKGNVVKITNADNGIYTATYDANGKMTSSTNANGKTFLYGYDANENIQSITGPEGFNATINVSPRGDIKLLTSAPNQTSTFEYDIIGRLIQLTDPLNNQSKISYDAVGNIVVMKNKKNEPVYINYDASNRVRKINGPLSGTMTFGYDGMDNVTSVTNAKGVTTLFEFNNKNLLSSIMDAQGNEITYSYDAKGNLITERLPTGRSVTYTYNALDMITAVSDNTGNLSRLKFDANGNVSEYTDANETTHSYEYDEMNRIKKYTDVLGNTIQLTYGLTGKIESIIDADGHTTSFGYDDLGRVVFINDRNGGTTSLDYDAAGNVAYLKDANNNITNYTFDELNRVKRTTFPDSRYTEYSYDKSDNVISFRDKDGSSILFTYDSLDRLKTKTLPGGEIFSYDYDITGKVISATNSAGTVYFTYDPLNRVASETFNGRSVTYSYNIKGRTQKITYPDNTEIFKSYDERGRLISIQKDGITLVRYAYNNAGQVISKSYANGIITNLEYDFAGRLSNLKTGNLQDLSFNYTKRGVVASIIRGTTNFSEFFGYDNNDRLTSYKRGKNGGAITINDTYTYDALGNRVSANIAGKNITYTTNNLNQLLKLNDGVRIINYTYDDNGNLTFDGKYHKIYDFEKRLLKDSASPSEVITYQYDAFGRKIKKSINNKVSQYTYQGFNRIEERDGNDILKSKLVFENMLTPVQIETNDVPFYYHQNHLGSIEMLTNSSGNVSEQYRYDVYGKPEIFDGNGNSIPGSVTGNQFGFTGQVYDSATGHLQFLYRNYNPESGLFDQQDLIGYADGMGLYQYVGNDPANGVDVFGLKCKETSTIVQVSEYAETITTWQGATITVIDQANKWKLARYLQNLEKSNKTLSEIEQALLSKNKELIKVIGKGSKLYQKGANAAKLSRIGNAGKATEAIGSAGKTAKFLGKTGTALGAVGVVTNAGQLINAGMNSEGPLYADPNVGVASADMIGSGLGFVPGFGWVYGLTDLAVSTITGESINQHVSNTSKSYFETTENAQVSQDILQNELDLIQHYKDIGKYDTYLKVLKKRRERTNTRSIPGCPENNNPNGTQRPPHGPRGDGTSGRTRVLQSNDPNEIIGPAGQPDKRWVSVKDRLPYTVTYENSEAATAPAKYVKVIVPVHEKMDPGTFQLSNLGFNNMTFSVPPLSASNYQRLDARDSLGLWIDMTAGFDPMKNEFFWEFQSIDPVTFMAPSDPLKGFLLTQDTTESKTNNGHGFVNFSIKPVANAHTLDSILAFASIVFDLNDTIPTNIEKNVIDAVAPTSHLDPLDANYNNFIPLSWSGQDDPNGCGVDFYTLYISTDGINFSILKDKIKRTDTTFTGLPNTSYYFFVLATDSVGNTEQMGPGAIKGTYLGAVLPVSWLYFTGLNKGKKNLLEWATANERNTKEYRVERSFDAQEFKPIGSVMAAGNTTGNSSYQFTDYDIDKLGESVMYYRLAQIDKDGRSQLSNVVRINYTSVQTSKTIVYPNPTKGMITIVIGDQELVGSVANLFDEAGKLLQSVKITSVNQQLNLSGYTNGIYFIKLANKEVLKIMKR